MLVRMRRSGALATRRVTVRVTSVARRRGVTRCTRIAAHRLLGFVTVRGHGDLSTRVCFDALALERHLPQFCLEFADQATTCGSTQIAAAVVFSSFSVCFSRAALQPLTFRSELLEARFDGRELGLGTLKLIAGFFLRLLATCSPFLGADARLLETAQGVGKFRFLFDAGRLQKSVLGFDVLTALDSLLGGLFERARLLSHARISGGVFLCGPLERGYFCTLGGLGFLGVPTSGLE